MVAAMHVHVSGEGPDLVLIHGVPGSSGSWAAVADRLAQDHRVHVPDLLGFGASPRPQSDEALAPPAQAEALAAALEPDRAVLVGHDYGGPVALALAAAHPERVEAVVLSATNAFPDTHVPFPLSTLFLPLVGGIAERALFSRLSLKLMLRQGTGRSDHGPDPRLAIGDESQHAAVRSIFASSLRHLAERYAPTEAALRGLECPAEVVWGDRDPFFAVALAERTAAAAPSRPSPVILEGAGHFLPEERPEELAAVIRRAAARSRPSPARTPARAAAR